jgi:hypothetical protein
MRVWKTGDLARFIVIPTALLFLVPGLAWLVSGELTELADAAIAGTFAVGAALAIARACVVGVWLTSDGAIARTWFRTYRFRRGHVSRCDSESYSGMFNRGNESTTFSMLVFSRPGKLPTPIRTTIALRRTSRRQLTELSAHFGFFVPAPDSVRPAHRHADLGD